MTYTPWTSIDDECMYHKMHLLKGTVPSPPAPLHLLIRKQHASDADAGERKWRKAISMILVINTESSFTCKLEFFFGAMAREEWEAFAFKSTLRHRLSGPEVPLHCETNLLRGSNVDNLAFKRDVTVKFLQEQETLQHKNRNPLWAISKFTYLFDSHAHRNWTTSQTRLCTVGAGTSLSKQVEIKHGDYQLVDTLLVAKCACGGAPMTLELKNIPAPT